MLLALSISVPSHAADLSMFPKKKPVSLSCVALCLGTYPDFGWHGGQVLGAGVFTFILQPWSGSSHPLSFFAPTHFLPPTTTTFSEPSWPPGEKAVSTPSPPFPTMVKACPSHPQHPHKMVPTRSFWSRKKLLVLRGTCGFLFAFHSLLLVNTSASVGLAPLNMNYYEFLP